MITITPEDLVRYLYKETSEKKTANIKAALETDWNLKEAYEKLLNAEQNLNSVNYSPRQEAVNKILQYANKKQAHVHSI